MLNISLFMDSNATKVTIQKIQGVEYEIFTSLFYSLNSISVDFYFCTWTLVAFEAFFNSRTGGTVNAFQ